MSIDKELLALMKALRRKKLPHALCGALAMSVHCRPRATLDIDLLVRKRDLPRIITIAGQLGFASPVKSVLIHPGRSRETRLHRLVKPDGEDTLALDLIEVSPSLRGIWISRKDYQTIHGRITVLSREGLIRMKRWSGRLQDLADIERMESDPQPPLDDGDMSSKAVTRRLNETGQLLKLCRILMKATDLGPVERPSVAAAAERNLKRELVRYRAQSAVRR